MPLVRLITAYPHRFGLGKTHAAVYMDNKLWGRDWYPLCVGDYIHAGPVLKVTKAQLQQQIDCKRCRARLDKIGWHLSQVGQYAMVAA